MNQVKPFINILLPTTPPTPSATMDIKEVKERRTGNLRGFRVFSQATPHSVAYPATITPTQLTIGLEMDTPFTAHVAHVDDEEPTKAKEGWNGKFSWYVNVPWEPMDPLHGSNLPGIVAFVGDKSYFLRVKAVHDGDEDVRLFTFIS